MTKAPPEVNEFITFKNSQGATARGTLLTLSQNHLVFETYNPYSVVQLSEVISSVTVYQFREKVYVGKAVVSSLINTGLMLIVSATLVDPWLEKLKPRQLLNAASESQGFVFEWKQLNEKVLPNYQLAVNKIRSFLTDTSRWVRQFDEFSDNSKTAEISNKEIITKISEPLLSNLAELFFQFEIEAKKVAPDQIDSCKRFAQQELHPLMMQSPFGYRTYHKPLGYAGDYEMVNMMIRDPYEGETTYAKLINLFLLARGPAEAHRNRIDILLKRIKEVAQKVASQGRRAQIFNFACGPAIEIQRFIEQEEISENCDFILLDFSQETLDYTSRTLERAKQKSGHKKVGIKLVHKSVNDVLRKAVGLRDENLEEHNNLDLVYCAGLFDYLSDRVCAKLMSTFFAQLSEGGELLATNVHSNNPAQGLMEHVFEWYLIYRNEQTFPGVIESKDPIIYSDSTGFNIFLEVKKTPNN